MRNIDFSSWQSLGATLIGLAMFTLIGVGIRLLMMLTIQQRRERMNRQINERLRTLIAAYKVLGGSFTGNLTVDPAHLRDLRSVSISEVDSEDPLHLTDEKPRRSDRPRRIRDAVEAALSDVILLGTDEQVRLAERAARELVAGRPVHTHELVIALRNFIRKALDLDPVPTDLSIPMQGPTRPSTSGGRNKGETEGSKRGGGSGSMGGGGMGGGGMGMTGGSIGSEEPPSSGHST
ncbi:hypothetical protein [Phyllobacterium myrsinacearum]|uniref:Putative membrane protein YgcG n=1 Tax=Phyllobacterium myrsinacearum TaxID=28101 RepID=A0A839ER46_9HYPH|nr:hypothetical protein [Phyllobacterium myrsinacearum]MBA8880698.1 putative membrane protein YgcG [Phyllobacterium myrsinacearum]